MTKEKESQQRTSGKKKPMAVEKKVMIHEEIVTQKIYVGPNLLGLPKYTVVESTNIPHIQKFIKDCPEIEKLFVSIEKMAEVETKATEKGTLEHRYYNKAMELRKGDN